MTDQTRLSLAIAIGRRLGIIAGQHARLLSAETRETATRLGGAAALLAVGALGALVGTLALTAAGIFALVDAGMSPAGAATLVGVGFLVATAVATYAGLHILRSASILPARTLGSLRRVADSFAQGVH